MLRDLLNRFSDPYVGTFGVDLSDEESERRLRSCSRKREFSFELDLIVGREEHSFHNRAIDGKSCLIWLSCSHSCPYFICFEVITIPQIFIFHPSKSYKYFFQYNNCS
ncbi:unnamed protein product [Musa textilis]